MKAVLSAAAFLCGLTLATAAVHQLAAPAPILHCPPYINTQKYRTTNFTDHANTTVSISPKRPKADVPLGSWISGRATF